MSSSSTSDTLERPGARVHYDMYQPSGAPRAVLHIVHGLAEHAARYKRVAEAFTGDGWVVFCPDQRGHGRTGRDGGVQGLFARAQGWRAVVDDLAAFVELERTQFPELPIFTLGHSMGSLVLQSYLTTFQGRHVTAAAYSGTSGPPPPIATVGRWVARMERLRQGKTGRSSIIDKLAFGAYNKAFTPARTDFDWLSRDPDEVDAYVKDPDCGFVATNQLWVDLLDALPALSSEASVARIPQALPLYFFSGSKDPVGLNGQGVSRLAERYRNVGLSVELKLYEGARHEVLNETNRQEVIQDLKLWFTLRLQDFTASR